MTKVSDLHQKWMKNKEYQKAHEELAPEFALARALIEARVTAGLTQEQLAQRMDTPPVERRDMWSACGFLYTVPFMAIYRDLSRRTKTYAHLTLTLLQYGFEVRQRYG